MQLIIRPKHRNSDTQACTHDTATPRAGSNMMARKRGPGQTRPRSDSSSGLGMVDPAAQKRKGKTAVNREFFQQLSRFLPILIPVRSSPSGLYHLFLSTSWSLQRHSHHSSSWKLVGRLDEGSGNNARRVCHSDGSCSYCVASV